MPLSQWSRWSHWMYFSVETIRTLPILKHLSMERELSYIGRVTKRQSVNAPARSPTTVLYFELLELKGGCRNTIGTQ
jgi:hypothetical protein